MAYAPAKPFAATHELQIQLAMPIIRNIDLDALSGIKADVQEIFEEAQFGELDRAEILSAALEQRCNRFKELAKAK